MVLEITRTIIRKASSKQLLELLQDKTSKINLARLKLNEHIGKSEFGGKEPIEMRRDELLAVLDICEPLLTQFADDEETV